MYGTIELHLTNNTEIETNAFEKHNPPIDIIYAGTYGKILKWKLESKNHAIETMKDLIKTLEQLPKRLW